MMVTARHVTLIWALLVVATLASCWLAERQGLGALTVPLLMLIALVKVRWVFLDFMELGAMARPWRLVFEVWIAVCAAAITGLYIYARI